MARKPHREIDVSERSEFQTDRRSAPIFEIRLADNNEKRIIRLITSDLGATSSPSVEGVDSSVSEFHACKLRAETKSGA